MYVYTTNYDVHSTISILSEKPYTHEADRTEILVQEVVRGIKRCALDRVNESPSTNLQGRISWTGNCKWRGANEPTWKKFSVEKYQSFAEQKPSNGISYSGRTEIRHPYDVTLDKWFLLFDSGAEDESRFIIFITNAALKYLSRSNFLFADGTFKTVPNISGQLYTVHEVVFEHIFPLVYVLTARKDQATYTEICNYNQIL